MTTPLSPQSHHPATPLRPAGSPSSATPRDWPMSPTGSPLSPSAGSRRDEDEPLTPTLKAGRAPKAHKHLQDIRAGDGRQRTGLLAHAEDDSMARRIGKHVARFTAGALAVPATAIVATLAVAGVGAGIGLGLGALAVLGSLRALCFVGRQLSERVLEPMADRVFRARHQPWIEALGQPVAGGTVADPRVQVLLQLHARQVGSPLPKEEITRLAATGERLVRALDQGACGKDGVLAVDGHAVPSSLYTTRAISWYLLARAAHKDLAREADQPGQRAGRDFPSAMVEEGAFRFQDPGHRLFDFMRAAPTVGHRAATHFEDRVRDPEHFRLLGKKKIKHWGLDDYTGQLPGKRGAILFNKLAPSVDGGPPEMYIKFERVGCPRLTAVEPHQGLLHQVARAPAALDRFLMHGMHYGEGLVRHKPHRQGVVVGQEHVHKGVLKKTIHEPLMALVRDALDAGLVRASEKGIARSVKKQGLAAVKQALDDLQTVLAGNKPYAERIKHLRQTISEHEAATAGGLPLVPRGAEALLAMFEQSLRPAGIDRLDEADFLSEPQSPSDSEATSASDSEAPSEPRLVQAAPASAVALEEDDLVVDLDGLR